MLSFFKKLSKFTKFSSYPLLLLYLAKRAIMILYEEVIMMRKASKVLFVISIVVTIIISAVFMAMYVDYHHSYLQANGEDTYKIALPIIILFLLIFGSIAYGLSSILNIVGLIMYCKDNTEKNKGYVITQSIFIVAPILVEVVIFLLFYLHP